eukprot:4040370-Amphidinium_carterae.1
MVRAMQISLVPVVPDVEVASLFVRMMQIANQHTEGGRRSTALKRQKRACMRGIQYQRKQGCPNIDKIGQPKTPS